MTATLGGYEIVREIARSNDIVYEARDPAMNRRIALKELALPPNLVGEQRRERIERFYREARAAGNLNHPNIVTIFKVGEENGRHYIAMEYLEGDTLRSLVQIGGPLPVNRAIEVCAQVCDALDYAHQRGVIHRDVKPDNIQILPDGAAKLTDFGIARLGSEPGLTQAGQVFGTPSYMSPEQIQGKPVDHRTDIFSMGVVLYEALTARKPFTGDSVVTITYNIMNMEPMPPPGVPPHLQAIVRRAMEKLPERRYQSAAEMARTLRQPPAPVSANPFTGATQHVSSLPRVTTLPGQAGGPAQPAGGWTPAAPPLNPLIASQAPASPPSYGSSASLRGSPAATMPAAPPLTLPGAAPGTVPLPPLLPPTTGLRDFLFSQGPFLSLLGGVLVLLGIAVLLFWVITSGFEHASTGRSSAGAYPLAPPARPFSTSSAGTPSSDSTTGALAQPDGSTSAAGGSRGTPEAPAASNTATTSGASSPGASSGGTSSGGTSSGGASSTLNANGAAAPSSPPVFHDGGPGNAGSPADPAGTIRQMQSEFQAGQQAQLRGDSDTARAAYQRVVDLYLGFQGEVPPAAAQLGQGAEGRLAAMQQ